ncbi:MAG: LLM class flavin-dependent oxidoreductase [Actinomycetota bacterium]
MIGELPVGVWLFPAAPADRLVAAIVRAEELGLDEVWVADEGVAREPVAVLAVAARETTRIRLAVGITTPLLRHPGALAASASTVDELSGGRFVLGLGVGGDKSLAPFGIEPTRPVVRLADAITTARAVLSGRPAEGYLPPDHAAPPRQVPIWVGARGPRLLELATSAADGIFVSGCSQEQHDRASAVRRSAMVGESAVGLALYQSAGRPARPGVVDWDDVGPVLSGEAARMGDPPPTSLGINLVDLLDPGTDPVAAVERAAVALGRG